jgi:peptidoglycan/xylan/chitin deacetylase (PgdA/CDA1 family)
MWRRRADERPFTLVLTYHRVVPDNAALDGRYGIERGVRASVFEAQLRFMLKQFLPIKASQVLEPASSPLRFAVTLDDGYEDNFQVALPVLRRLGIPATFYVVSDFVGTDRLFWWEKLATMVRTTSVSAIDIKAALPELAGAERLPETLPIHTDALRGEAYERLSRAIRADAHAALPRHLARLSAALNVDPCEEGREYALMNWSQLRKLVAEGHEIGGHTATHSNVVGLDEAMLQRELGSSIADLERELGAPVLSFAYPYGLYDRVRNVAGEVLARTNCRVAFTAEKGVVQGQASAYELPRACLNRRYGFACAFNVQDMLNQS